MKKLMLGLLALTALAACTKREVVRDKQSGVPVEAKAVTTPLPPATVVPTPAPTASSEDAALGTLQIKDQEVGTGSEAVTGHKVSVNYTGRLLTGKQFDTSIGRGPFSFTLGAGQVIKGWDMGVAGMKVGGKRQLVIPPHLGYGASGAGGIIPPNATLVFDVELLGVE